MIEKGEWVSDEALNSWPLNETQWLEVIPTMRGTIDLYEVIIQERIDDKTRTLTDIMTHHTLSNCESFASGYSLGWKDRGIEDQKI